MRLPSVRSQSGGAPHLGSQRQRAGYETCQMGV